MRCSRILACAIVALATVFLSVRTGWTQVPVTPNPLRGDAEAIAADGSAAGAAPANESTEDAAPSLPESSGASLLEPLSEAQLTERLERLIKSGLDESQLAPAQENYRQALQFRTAAIALRDQAKPIRQRVEQRAELILQKKVELEKPLPALPPLPTELTELEAVVLQLEQRVADMHAARDAIAGEIKAHTARIGEIPRELTGAEAELREVEDALKALGAASRGADEAAASQLVVLVNRRQMLQFKIAKLQQEQLLASSSELLQLELDLVVREVSAAEKHLAAARADRSRLQQAEADRQAREAAQAAQVERPAVVAKIASRNAELAARRQGLTADANDLKDELSRRKDELESLQKQFAGTSARVDAAGLSVSAGKLLLRQQKNLPHANDLRRRAAARLAADDRDQFVLYELQDQREALADLDARVEEVVAGAEGPAPDEAEVRTLLEDQRKYLDGLVESYTDSSNDANALASTEESLAALSESYSEYIAERVLWIRSSAALWWDDVRPAVDAVRWSLNPLQWRDAGMAVWDSFELRPIQSAALLIPIIALLAIQGRVRRRLREVGAVAEKRTCADFSPTVRALGFTLLAALPWPALLWFVGWSMDHPAVESDFVRSLSGSTRIVAQCLLLLEVIRMLCRSGGLADAHFDWPDPCLIQLRRHVRWLTMLGLPLLLWIVGLELQEAEPLYSSSLGRVGFIALMLLVAYRLQRMLFGKTSPFRTVLQTEGWWEPIEHLWRPAAVLLPAVLSVLAVAGYYYSAQQAALRLVESLVLLVVVLVAGGMTVRWLLTNRRSLAREQARQRRAQLAAAAAAATAASSEGDGGSPAAPPVEIVDDTVDLAALSEQTQKLVRTSLAILALGGLYLIWDELLPAVAFWISEPIPGFELKWSQALAFVAVLAVTYVAVRDIPALLELVILQRLPLDAGSRYALSTISRYGLAGIGLSAAYSLLGFTGENIQWLVAAMGVGLGFGLQEIFANFVSGIILLFERPLRVGDVVTLGEKTGAVTRIRMRATTIVDWDRKEYIVPNKDLVTERLLNWTLSDQTNRVVVNVGVAYGSDTDAACRLLIESAREVPAVTDDPSPIATFEGFGDNSLKLVLRAYLPNLENRLATIHALHSVIDRKFREAGLEIPFPQRDLNLRDVPEAWLAPATQGPPAGGQANGTGAGGVEKADENPTLVS